MLTGMPLFYAALVTGMITFLILMVHKKGFHLLANIIFAMVMLVAIAYAIELFLAKPNVTNIAKGMFIPHLNSESLLVAIGIIGATVMPHNIFLHSDIVREHHEKDKKKALGYAIKNSVLSLNIAWFINSAMIIVAASVFFYQGIEVSSIEETYKTLEPTLGSLAGLMFAIALVSAGLSSSVTGTMAGQSILEGFLHISFPIWIRRLITMVPALVIIGMGVDTLKALVISQVVLSMQLPFTILPLLLLTSKKDIMGNYQNKPLTIIALWSIAILIIGLNVFLIGQTLN
jgi:manganese transport protein